LDPERWPEMLGPLPAASGAGATGRKLGDNRRKGIDIDDGQIISVTQCHYRHDATKIPCRPRSAYLLIPASFGLTRKSRQFENTAIPVTGTGHCDVNSRAIRRGGDAIKAGVVEGATIDIYPSDRYDGAVLAHAQDRIVAAIGDVKLGILLDRRVARPPDVRCLDIGRSKIDRQVEERRIDPANVPGGKDLIARRPGNDEVDHRDGVVERLADKELLHYARLLNVGVHEDPKPRFDILVRRVPAQPEERLDRARGRQSVQPLLGVFLDNCAIRRDDAEDGPTTLIRRRTEKKRFPPPRC